MAKSAREILEHAGKLVGEDRESTHGRKRENFEKIAKLWDAYLLIRRDPDAPLSPEDVGMMMVILKVARTQLGNFNPDDFYDMAGYSGCVGEIAMETES